MCSPLRSNRFGRGLWALALIAILLPSCSPGESAEAGSAATPETSFTIDGRVALNSLLALSDGHLRKMADALTLLAGTAEVRSGDWERVRGPLQDAARMNVPAVHWFALPDGKYWTTESGLASQSLADRPYFPGLLAGETVLGHLVVSRSTNRNTAIVAVPVRGREGTIVGALGASVHLDSLSLRLEREMGFPRDGFVFFAIDEEPLGALNSDPNLIFTEPMKLGEDESMSRAFTEMLANEEGVVSYVFRGAERTVLYRRSPETGWWYGLGIVEVRGG